MPPRIAATTNSRIEPAKKPVRKSSREDHSIEQSEPIAIWRSRSRASFAYDRAMTSLRSSNPSRDYPIQGIDVSHHQGAIDWKELAAQAECPLRHHEGDEGGDHRDTHFAENWQAAKEAGIVPGAYHSSPSAAPAASRRRTCWRPNAAGRRLTDRDRPTSSPATVARSRRSKN